MTAPLSWDQLRSEVEGPTSWDALRDEVESPPRRGVEGGGYGMLADIGRQGLRGLARSGYRTAIGLTDLLGFDDTADKLREGRDDAESFYGEAKTTPGKVAGAGAAIAGDLVQYAAPGALLSRVAAIPSIARAVPGASKVLRPATRGGRIGRDVALGAPVNLAAGIQPEESAAGTFGELLDSDLLRRWNQHTGSRLGFEVGFDALAGGLAENVAEVLKNREARRAVSRVDAQLGEIEAAGHARIEAAQDLTETLRPRMTKLRDAESVALGRVAEREAAEASLTEQVEAVLARRETAREASQARSRETVDLARQHDEELLRANRLAKDADELRYPLTNSVREALERFQRDVGKAASRRAPTPEAIADATRAPRTPAADPFPRSSVERRTISRQEFGPVDTPEQMTAARERAREFMATAFQGKRFTNQATGITAEVSTQSIGKARYQARSAEKVAALRVLDELIEDAEPIALNVPPRTPATGGKKKSNVLAYHYFQAEAIVDGSPVDYRLTLREERPPKGAPDRRVFYWDIDVNDPAKGARASRTGPSGGPTSRVADPSRETGAPATSRPLGETTSSEAGRDGLLPEAPTTSRPPDRTVAAGTGVVNDLPYPEQPMVRETAKSGRISWDGGAPKFRRTSTDELEAAHARLLREYEALANEHQQGHVGWSRFDPNVQEQRSGVFKNRDAGRASAGMKQVWRQLEAIERELAGRYNALDPDDLARRETFAFGEDGEPITFKRPARQDEATPFDQPESLDTDSEDVFGGVPAPWVQGAGKAAAENLIGGAAGATAGGLLDEENPGRGMAAGFIAGAGGQAALKALLDRAGAAGHLVAPKPAPVAGRVELPASRWQPRGAAPTPGPTRPVGPTVDPATVDEDEFFNFRRALLDPSGERTLREQVRQVAATEGLAPKAREAQATVIANSLGIDPSDITPGVGDRIGRTKLLALRNAIVQNADAIAEGHRRLATGTLTPDERAIIERGVQTLESQQQGFLGQFIRQRSETGRDLAALKILAKRSTDPAVWLSRATEVAQRPLTGDEVLRVRELANQGRTDALAREVASLRKATAAEKGTTLLKATLLTSPTTHIANLMGNTTMAMLETAKDAPAMLIDRMLGRVAQVVSRGTLAPKATKHFSLQQVQASARGAKAGLDEAKAVMRGTPIEGALQKYDFTRETNYDNAILDGFTKTVFRALQAGDRIFYGAAFQRSLTEQATLLAKREGLRGEALRHRIQELSDLKSGAPGVTDDMVLQAIADAELAIFTNRGLLARIGGRIKGELASSGSVPHVAGEVVMPFVRTPANVVSRAVEYSPLGALGTIPDVMRLVEAAMKGEPAFAAQRQIANRLGRSATGSVPIIAGAILAASGRMTGTYPTDQKTRTRWAQEGKIPNAVRIGDRWHSLERISPLGNLMAVGASVVHHLEENLAPDDAQRDPLARGPATALAGVQAVGDIGKFAMEQSFLTGVNRSLDAVRDPERGGMGFVEGLAGMAVPSVVGRVARAIDPVQREVEGPLDALRGRVPGLSKGLPAKVDAFGEEITREGGAAALFDPTNSRRDRTSDDWVAAELAKVGATLGRRQRGRDETPSDYEFRLKREGTELRAVVEAVILSEEYQQLPGLLEEAASYDNAFRTEYPPGSPARERLVREMRRDLINDAVRSSRAAFTRAGVGRQYAEASP